MAKSQQQWKVLPAHHLSTTKSHISDCGAWYVESSKQTMLPPPPQKLIENHRYWHKHWLLEPISSVQKHKDRNKNDKKQRIHHNQNGLRFVNNTYSMKIITMDGLIRTKNMKAKGGACTRRSWDAKSPPPPGRVPGGSVRMLYAIARRSLDSLSIEERTQQNSCCPGWQDHKFPDEQLNT